MKGRELKRLLSRVGYRAERTKGSHMRMVADGRPTFSLSYHDRADVAPGAVRAVLERQARLTPQEISELLGD